MSATVTALGPVLVGVDGSRRNASAVAWATAEAGSSSAPLVLVHDLGRGASEAAGRATVDRAVALVAKIDPGLAPATEVVHLGPATGLVRTAESYDKDHGSTGTMVVVGRRGSGGFTRLSLGSTARTMVHEAGPPTVVVPSGWSSRAVPDDAPVVVDVTPPGDGKDSEGAAHLDPGDHELARDRALGLALARAQRDGRPVVAVHAWSVDPSEALEGRAIRDVWGEHADRAERELADLLREWRAVYPGVEVRGVTTDRHPVAALLDQAQQAELLVVPRGGRGSAVVEMAVCPVAVV